MRIFKRQVKNQVLIFCEKPAELQFRADVRIDFAAENDFFEYRTGPSHEGHPFYSEIFAR